MTCRARVLLVDDSEDIRDLYRRLIEKQSDLECVAAMESTVGLEDAVKRTNADVAVIDLVGPGRDALEAIRSVSVACPRCRIIAFSGHDDDTTRDHALQAGAWSLVSKHDDAMTLLDEIRRVLSL